MGHYSKRAIFLDRDGVINEDLGYVHRIEDFRFLPGVFEALRRLQKMGYALVVVTNQSGIGRGFYGEEEFMRLSGWMRERLQEEGIELLDILHCPHHPDAGCECRKPEPGMILEAARRHGIDLGRSWMVGDRPSDIEAARRAGVGGAILLQNQNLIDVVDDIKEIG